MQPAELWPKLLAGPGDIRHFVTGKASEFPPDKLTSETLESRLLIRLEDGQGGGVVWLQTQEEREFGEEAEEWDSLGHLQCEKQGIHIYNIQDHPQGLCPVVWAVQGQCQGNCHC